MSAVIAVVTNAVIVLWVLAGLFFLVLYVLNAVLDTRTEEEREAEYAAAREEQRLKREIENTKHEADKARWGDMRWHP